MRDFMIADAHDAVKMWVAECNDKAKALMAATTAFAQKNAERILGADDSRVMALAMDLVDARSRLNEAWNKLDELRRRTR